MPRYLCAAHQYWTVMAALGPTHEHDGQPCWSLSFCTLRGAVLSREQLGRARLAAQETAVTV